MAWMGVERVVGTERASKVGTKENVGGVERLVIRLLNVSLSFKMSMPKMILPMGARPHRCYGNPPLWIRLSVCFATL